MVAVVAAAVACYRFEIFESSMPRSYSPKRLSIAKRALSANAANSAWTLTSRNCRSSPRDVAAVCSTVSTWTFSTISLAIASREPGTMWSPVERSILDRISQVIHNSTTQSWVPYSRSCAKLIIEFTCCCFTGIRTS